MENNKTTAENQQIDLSYLWKSTKNFFENITFSIFRFFSFFLRNKIATIILLIIGIALGVYVYKNDKNAYRNVVVVATNFGSTEYTYNKINNFNRVEQYNFPGLKHISKIEIEPVVDVYSFLSDEKDNIEMAKYMSENTIEVSKYKKENNVEKLYRYHKIKYTTDVHDDDGKIYQSLIDYLNSDKYFAQIQQIEKKETQNRLVELEKSVESINAIFDNLGGNSTDGKGDIKIDMYSQINELMLTKNKLLQRIAKTKVQLIEEEKIVYDVSSNRNLYSKSMNKSIVLVLVILFSFYVVSQAIKKFKKFKNEQGTL